jgi:ABC-type uncharacterized transport system involved in gliding motility auxiliary subunit
MVESADWEDLCRRSGRVGSYRVVVIVLFAAGLLSSCAGRSAAPSTPTPTPTVASRGGSPAGDEQPGGVALTEGSKRILGSLTTVLRIDAYVGRGVPEVAHFVRDLQDLLTEYEREGKGKVKVHFIEPDTDELREQARQEGLQEQAWGAQGEDAAVIAQGYLGLVFKYGSEKGVIPQLPYQESDGLEFWISNKIREIRDKAHGIKHRIGVVTGKDELKLSDTNLVPRQGQGGGPSIEGVLEQAFPFYALEEVDLRQGASAIDPNLVGLIITQPRSDYIELELRRIDEFLMLGEKSLTVYASAVNLRPGDPSLLATLSTRGLETLLDGYGLHMNRNAVFDHGAPLSLPVLAQSGSTAAVRHPGVAHVVSSEPASTGERRLDTGFAGFFRMDEVMFPFASSLELAREKQPTDVQLHVVARSTPEASVDDSATVDMRLREQWTPKPPLQQRILAAYAQGKLRSAFAGRPASGFSTPERARRSSRVLVVSSSLFLTNPFAYAGNAPTSGAGSGGGDVQLLMLAQPYTKYLTSTILSVKNTLDWMTGDEDLVATSAKLIGPRHR